MSGKKSPFLVRHKGLEPLIERTNENQVAQGSKAMPSHERLFQHATMSSARRRAAYKQNKAPKDHLDFVMESLYDPLENTFPEKGDHYLHIETVYSENDPEYRSWRVLRNCDIVIPPKPLVRGHPIVYGGVKEKESIFHVKLGIGSDHSPQTYAGYSRTPSGSFYTI